jgi:hypothetical protein
MSRDSSSAPVSSPDGGSRNAGRPLPWITGEPDTEDGRRREVPMANVCVARTGRATCAGGRGVCHPRGAGREPADTARSRQDQLVLGWRADDPKVACKRLPPFRDVATF